MVVVGRFDTQTAQILTECGCDTPTEWYCGYIGVGPDHVLYGCSYDEDSEHLTPPEDGDSIGARGVLSLFCNALDDFKGHSPELCFDVHGSLTFSGSCDSMGPMDTVKGDFWWFGFDCHHGGDNPDDHDEIYVKQECERLATQLAAVLTPKGERDE